MVASEYRKVKYFTGNGRISGLNGNFGRLNGEAGWEELAPEYWKTSRLSPVFKAPHVNPTCGAPRCTPHFTSGPPSMTLSALSRDTSGSRAARVRFSLHL